MTVMADKKEKKQSKEKVEKVSKKEGRKEKKSKERKKEAVVKAFSLLADAKAVDPALSSLFAVKVCTA
jgi:hypothetical protein